MKRLLSLSLLAVPLVTAACTGGERASSGECPAGEICSDATPRGLHFIGNDMADQVFGSAFGPAATAIGGTQDIALEYDRGDGVRIALNLPYQADDDGGIGVEVVATSGSVVTMRGVGSRKNYLRIVEPGTQELYDRYELAGAAIESIRLIGTEFERLPTERPEIVWATGDQEIGVALTGEVQNGNSNNLERLIDTSMVLSLAGSERTGWDTVRLPSATVGIHTLSVEAGDKPALNLPVEIVAGADTIEVIGSATPTVTTNGSETVCFAAMSGTRYIYGLTWQFNVDGDATTHDKNDLTRNCISVSAGTRTSGTIQVAAAAGGRQANVSVTIGAAARSTADVATGTFGTAVRSAPTEGDRARM